MLQDLIKRKLIKQTNNIDKLTLLDNKPITFYVGFDPTAASLHVGHLLQLKTATRLIAAGHHCIILIGNATASVGDPSGKSTARPVLSSDEIHFNTDCIKQQIGSILKHGFIFRQNGDWLNNISFLDMMGSIGKHLSINTMLRSECFKSRLETGLTLQELCYMAMQALDFLTLYQTSNCILQVGGDDQWSNMLAGIDLIRKKTKEHALCFTVPLLTLPDGTKMGKTEKGAVWLDSNKTTPFEFFQFWRCIPDAITADVVQMLSDSDVSSDVNGDKELLASELTELVHGHDASISARNTATSLFVDASFADLTPVPVYNGITVIDALVLVGFAKSKSDARNLILGKGVTVNDCVVVDIVSTITNNCILRKGKKSFASLIIGS